MAWQVHYDDEHGTAVLIDPGGPWALGPCLNGGPHAPAALTAFVEGLDQDPAELTAWELATMWMQFLAAMGEVAGEADEPTSAILPDGESTAALEAGRDEPPPPAPADDGSEAESEQVAVEAPPARPEQHDPCPNCRSTKRELLAGGTIVCGVCGVELGG